MVGQTLDPLTEPSPGPVASAILFRFKGRSTKQQHAPLCPLYALHTFIKYTNYKALGWFFWLTKEAKTGTGFRQPFGDSFPSTATPKLPLQITSHFQVLFCATAPKDIYQNCFHCYCLKNHIFSKKKAPLYLCFQSDKFWYHVDFFRECLWKCYKSLEATRMFLSLQLSDT